MWVIPPFQGWHDFGLTNPQGVAVGWNRTPRWGCKVRA